MHGLEVELDRLAVEGGSGIGLACRGAQLGRVWSAEVAGARVARHPEREVAAAAIDDLLIVRTRNLPAVLAVGDRAKRHIVEGLGVRQMRAGLVLQRQVL